MTSSKHRARTAKKKIIRKKPTHGYTRFRRCEPPQICSSEPLRTFTHKQKSALYSGSCCLFPSFISIPLNPPHRPVVHNLTKPSTSNYSTPPMSALKLQPNPFLVHGRSQSDNNYLSNASHNNKKGNKTYHLDMPRTYSPPSHVSTPYMDRKRKFEEDLLITPEHSNNHDALITPPRSYKRSRTVPSSPVNSHDIYETPKTPSFRQDIVINFDGANSNTTPRSPEYRASTFYNTAENVTPPHSTSGSPKQASANIASPTVVPSRKSQGNEYAYFYADTCYPFNISGSAIGRSEGNLRLKTWREACNEKVRHEYNKALKEYNAFSTTLTEAARNRMSKTAANPPPLFDAKIFPSATKMSRAAYGQLNYPFSNPIDNSEEKAEYEARLLLGLRNHESSRPKNDYPLKHSSHVQLPPISEILKYTPFDKSTVHPSGLSTLEINQYQNSKFPGIVFNSASKEFYNGREIKKNLPVPVVDHELLNQDYQRMKYGSLGGQPTQPFYANAANMNRTQYRGPYRPHASYCSSTISAVSGSTHMMPAPQLQSPITLKPLRSQGANAYDDLNNELKNLSDDGKSKDRSQGKTLKQFQTQFKTQPLKVTKTRRASVSKVAKSAQISTHILTQTSARRRRSSSASSSRPVSRPSSRSTSRRSSRSGVAFESTKLQEDAVSATTTTGYGLRTRSSSRSRTRCSSSESIKTAEVPASVETTPKSSPVVQKTQTYVAKTNSLLFPTYDPSSVGPATNAANGTNRTLDFSKSTILSVAPVKAQLPVAKLHSDSSTHSHNHSPSAHQTHPTRAKKCMSCFSSLSPCWRPSWAPDEGQLCNSCGLRYRKTKARCFNPACLKIPSKSEWALMVKRGEVLLDMYDSQGHVVGKRMSYRCLDCDSAMEVSR